MTCYYCENTSTYVSNSEIKCPDIIFSEEIDLKEIKFFQPNTFELDVADKESLLECINSPEFDSFIRDNYKPINLNTHFIIFRQNKSYKHVTHFWCQKCFEYFISKQTYKEHIKKITNPIYLICRDPTILDMKLKDDFQTCIDCRIEIYGICYSCEEYKTYFLCRDCFYKAREKFGIKFVKTTPLGYSLPSFGCSER